ncbi:NMRL1 protein, partial [Atractosteus spatula]|nr:NMRL1 protein [Atractosteus spatula]
MEQSMESLKRQRDSLRAVNWQPPTESCSTSDTSSISISPAWGAQRHRDVDRQLAMCPKLLMVLGNSAGFFHTTAPNSQSQRKLRDHSASYISYNLSAQEFVQGITCEACLIRRHTVPTAFPPTCDFEFFVTKNSVLENRVRGAQEFERDSSGAGRDERLVCSSLPLLKVVGAQGGSVARALLQHPGFEVRAATRDPKKPAAVELGRLGAQLVKADVGCPAEVEAALRGSYGAFLVTNFWEHLDKSTEVKQEVLQYWCLLARQCSWLACLSAQLLGIRSTVHWFMWCRPDGSDRFSPDKLKSRGKMVADLAKKLGLQHVVYSGLENVHRLTGGKLTVLHFDGKGEVEEYFRSLGVPTTSVRLPFYFENFTSFFKPAKVTDSGAYVIGVPMGDVPMDGMSVADLGPVVVSVLMNREEFVGKDIGLSAERLTVQQYCEVMTRCLGKTFVDAKMSPEDYEKLGFPGAPELANMFRFYMMKPDRDLALTRRLYPQVLSFEQWLLKNKAAFQDL